MELNKFGAVMTTIVYSTLVIVSLYLHPFICPQMKLNLYRPIAIILMAVISYFLLFYFEINDQFHLVNSPSLSKLSILSTIILFSGPIIQNLFSFFDTLNDDFNLSIGRYIRKKYYDLKYYGTHEIVKSLIIGPLTEEMIYRAFGCGIWEKAKISNIITIFLLPFQFGVSHFNKYFLEKSGTFKQLFPRYFGQVVFTTLFGWWESFVWLKTHSFLTCVFIHSFCNYMQFPDFDDALNWPHPIQKIFLFLSYLVGIIYFFFSIGLIQTYK